jgi:glycosyltransferase involved in cell wall biosynthesis/acetyltransferase-like isoleucine patch superfamily enzyme/SAM-dependent methyltransferase
VKFSLVVPAYNVEAFIDRCLDSILAQSFEDYEIVVVDDGSTDRTNAILRRRAEQNSKIRLFTQVRKGQGAARNFAVTIARGDWIWFVDSDDWIAPASLGRIAALTDRFDPEVIVVNFERVFDSGEKQPSVPPASGLSGGLVEPARDETTFSSLSCWVTPPWRLVARRDILIEHNVKFAEGLFYEDHPFAIRLMLSVKRVFVHLPVSYSYFQRDSSTTRLNDKKAFDFIAVRRTCIEMFKQFGAYERFPNLVSSYIAPVDFYNAHVSEPNRRGFLQALSKELTAQEEAFARAHGGPSVGRFLDEVRQGRAGQRLQTTVIDGPAADWVATRWKRAEHRLRRLREQAWRLTGPGRKAAKERKKLRRLVQSADQAGFLKVGRGARIERIDVDVRVNPQRRPYVIVGDESHVGGRYVFERGLGQISIGARSSIGGGCLFVCTQPEGIRVGDNAMLSWDVTVIDTDAHSLDPSLRQEDAYDWKCGLDVGRQGVFKDWSGVSSKPIVIEDGAWVGFGAVIMKGVTIGKGAVVGARSVVTRDVAPYNVVAGNPARFVRLVPRQKWSWEDIVHALQGDPTMADALENAYLNPDFKAALRRYRESEEFRDTAALAREFAPRARRMLEVGAGAGFAAVAFALEGFEVTALEPSDDPLVGAQAIGKMIGEGERIDATVADRVRIVHGAIETTALEGGFDLVLCRQVAHHFSDPVHALERIRKLVTPTAVVLLVREHVIFDEEDRARFLENHLTHRYCNNERGYSADQYQAMARRAGFEVARVLKFADSPINYYPRTFDAITRISERDVPGRPYTFVLKLPEAAA